MSLLWGRFSPVTLWYNPLVRTACLSMLLNQTIWIIRFIYRRNRHLRQWTANSCKNVYGFTTSCALTKPDHIPTIKYDDKHKAYDSNGQGKTAFSKLLSAKHFRSASCVLVFRKNREIKKHRPFIKFKFSIFFYLLSFRACWQLYNYHSNKMHTFFIIKITRYYNL
jgi:hypothetical protein